uniref:Calcineurin-like phosphoesterase domain-containing protein n=1 Tax=Aegilops tauschii TaxID=37682 RepID=M8CE04_AEGTA
MQSATRLTLLLCAAWVAALLYGEMGAYWAAHLSCSWPSASSSSPSPSNHVKVAVIADPQLMDRTSLSLPPGSVALQAAEFFTDLNMRRSFQSVVLPFKPDVVLFLGDYFDGGTYLSDEDLVLPWTVNVATSSRLKDELHAKEGGKVISRYEKEFGPRNFQFLSGKVDFVVVDAQTLDAKELLVSVQEEPHRAKKDPLLGSSSKHYQLRIYSAAMDQGIKYQNYLSKQTSDLLLGLLKPILVLSGHDHDQCTVVHSTPFGPVMEFVLTVLLLMFWPTNGLSSLPYVNAFVSFMSSAGADLFPRSKEKDDTEDGEYEMVWDAEGSMHLVKKAVARPPITNADSKTTGRGNVVARPTARKHQPEPDSSSVHVEMGSETAPEDGGKAPRPSKWKIRTVLQRLFRVVQSVAIIAVLNVPLYMMLLFKDWVDR